MLDYSKEVEKTGFLFLWEETKLAFVEHLILAEDYSRNFTLCWKTMLWVSTIWSPFTEVETRPPGGPWELSTFGEVTENLSKSKPVCWFPFIYLEINKFSVKQVQTRRHSLEIVHLFVWYNDQLVKYTHGDKKKHRKFSLTVFWTGQVEFGWLILTHPILLIMWVNRECFMKKKSQSLQNWVHSKFLHLDG